MRRAIGSKQAGVRPPTGVPAVGLHLAHAGRVHGSEVGIGNDDLGAQPLQSARDPLAVGQGLEAAVRGMLPKNRLGRRLFTKLKIYRGADHPHAAQQPQQVEL